MNTLAGICAVAIAIIANIILFIAYIILFIAVIVLIANIISLIASAFSTKNATYKALVIFYVTFTLLVALIIVTWVTHGLFIH